MTQADEISVCEQTANNDEKKEEFLPRVLLISHEVDAEYEKITAVIDDEGGTKMDMRFDYYAYISQEEHAHILSEERARLSELEKKFEKRLTGVIYELYAKEKSKEEFNALIDSALAKLKAKSSVGDEGDK